MYEILDELKGASHDLPQALGQLSRALQRTLDEYDVYETDGEASEPRITAAAHHLRQAAQLAAQLAGELAWAQAAIVHQRCRPLTR